MKQTAILCIAFCLSLAPLPLTAAVHTVEVIGLTFVPAELDIDQGDTVEWVHDGTSTFHTLTSGTGAADPQAGALFDVTFASPGQVFSQLFADSGDVPYFCRPHVSLGMTGLLHVNELVAAEPSAWGRVKALYR
jgi:plastocyanin